MLWLTSAVLVNHKFYLHLETPPLEPCLLSQKLVPNVGDPAGRRFLLPAGDSDASHQSASFPSF